jgi:hypothetical protein
VASEPIEQRHTPQRVPVAACATISSKQLAACHRLTQNAQLLRTIPCAIPVVSKALPSFSQDGMLANAAGIMPTSLKFEADQRFFETCLDAVKPTTQPCPSSVASLSSRPLI